MSRSRTLLLTTLAGLLFAAPAFADDVPLPQELAVDELELLPLDDNLKQLIILKNPKLFDTLFWLGRRVQQTRARLRKRKNPHDGAGQKLRREIGQLEARLKPLLRDARIVLRSEGISDEMLAKIKQHKVPRGPRRQHRYAHKLVLTVTGLEGNPKRLALMRQVVHGLDGAQLALMFQQSALRTAIRKSKAPHKDPTRVARQQMISALNAQIYRMEHRFWMLVDYMLDQKHRQALRVMLPQQLKRVRDPLGHALRLPGITPSQGARIKALVAELTSEATADQAEVRRYQRAMRNRGLSWPQRKKLRDEMRVVQLRLAKLTRRIILAGRKVLTPGQQAVFAAIPPMISPRERGFQIRRIVQGMSFSLEQRTKIHALQRRSQAARRTFYSELGRVRMMGQNFGPDSPQQMSMQMMRMGLEAEARTVTYRAARELFLKVLTPQQIVAWLVRAKR